jgi:hypothetical protein
MIALDAALRGETSFFFVLILRESVQSSVSRFNRDDFASLALDDFITARCWPQHYPGGGTLGTKLMGSAELEAHTCLCVK